METERARERERQDQVTRRGEKTQTQQGKDRQEREYVITGDPVFSKPLFYPTLPASEKRERGGGGGGEENYSPSFSRSQTTDTQANL